MVKSKLPNSTLGKIWKLSDIGDHLIKFKPLYQAFQWIYFLSDKDGMLDADEFALANYLVFH